MKDEIIERVEVPTPNASPATHQEDWDQRYPDPARDRYYLKGGDSEIKRYITGPEWHPGLRLSLMALPDLLIAYHITGKQRYMDELSESDRAVRRQPRTGARYEIFFTGTNRPCKSQQ